MKRLRILLMFGGESSEHDVSLKSAKNVFAAINKRTYDVSLAYIDKSGRWWLLDDWTDEPEGHRNIQLVVAPGTGTVLSVPGSQIIPVDVLFPVLHGKLGEDGTIQGLAAMAHIPIVGCGVESSAVCMDKHVTKRLLQAAGIPVVPWATVQRGGNHKAAIKHLKELNKQGPWFVKPSRAGSSVGVTRVTEARHLSHAIKAAHEHDDLALIEVAVTGRELEVAVLGNTPTHTASGIGEIIPGSEFYDYDDKYSADSSSKTILDAKLPRAVTSVIRQHALDSYGILGCSGLARVDFLLSDEGVPYVNEVNTLPGFTDISMYPKLWAEKGLGYDKLIDRLIELALE